MTGDTEPPAIFGEGQQVTHLYLGSHLDSHPAMMHSELTQTTCLPCSLRFDFMLSNPVTYTHTHADAKQQASDSELNHLQDSCSALMFFWKVSVAICGAASSVLACCFYGLRVTVRRVCCNLSSDGRAWLSIGCVQHCLASC